jgi:hypothetical protein
MFFISFGWFTLTIFKYAFSLDVASLLEAPIKSILGAMNHQIFMPFFMLDASVSMFFVLKQFAPIVLLAALFPEKRFVVGNSRFKTLIDVQVKYIATTVIFVFFLQFDKFILPANGNIALKMIGMLVTSVCGLGLLLFHKKIFEIIGKKTGNYAIATHNPILDRLDNTRTRARDNVTNTYNVNSVEQAVNTGQTDGQIHQNNALAVAMAQQARAKARNLEYAENPTARPSSTDFVDTPDNRREQLVRAKQRRARA